MTRRYRRHKNRNVVVMGLVVVGVFVMVGVGVFIKIQGNSELSVINELQTSLRGVQEWVLVQSRKINVTNKKEMVKPYDPLENATQVLKIGVMSDSHGKDQNIVRALEAMQVEGVDYVLHLGDFSEGGEAEHFFNAKSILDESGLPYRVLPGDHDFNWFPDYSRQNYEQAFGQSYDEVFEVNGIRLIMFENSTKAGSRDLQMGWLESTLEDDKDQITLFFSARPLYSPYFTYKEDELGSEIIDILVSHGVGYAFAGDTHIFAKYMDLGEQLDMITVGAVGEYKNPLPQWVLIRVFDNGYVEAIPKPIINFISP